MANDDLTEFDRINIGAALLTQLESYEKCAKMEDEDNARKAEFESVTVATSRSPDGRPYGATGWDNDGWDTYWNDRVSELRETISKWDPKLLERN